MSHLEALVLGILQGITEFLPISSSAHLKLSKLLFGIEEGEGLVIFDLACHAGTLVALLVFLRADILALFRDRKKFGLLALATLPLIPFYFLLKPVRDFAGQTPFLGLFLIMTAAILFVSGRWRVQKKERSAAAEALWIGALQGTALIPGISRSASTIGAAHVLGWEAKEAVRFSFLLSIPTVLGGCLLECLKLSHAPQTLALSHCVIGFLAAGAVGLLVIRYAMGFLEKGDLKPFAWYCFALGILTTFFVMMKP